MITRLFLFIGLNLFWVLTTKAQINTNLQQLKKIENSIVGNAKNASSAALLQSLDAQLKNKFSLDGVKSQLLGNTLNVKLADMDFTKLNPNAQGKQATLFTEAIKNSIATGNLKSLGISTIVVEMVKSMSVPEILQTLKTKL